MSRPYGTKVAAAETEMGRSLRKPDAARAPINQLTMLTGYVNPVETYIADPNQDVVYGLGYLALEKEPVVIQVPD